MSGYLYRSGVSTFIYVTADLIRVLPQVQQSTIIAGDVMEFSEKDSLYKQIIIKVVMS